MFIFKLQRVLEIRDQIEKDANIHYTNLILKRELLEKLLADEKAGYFEDKDLWTQAVKLGDLGKQNVFDVSIENRKKKIISILERINEIKEEIFFAESALKEARRNLKVIEKLKENQKNKYEKIVIKREKQEMDEYALKKFREDSNFIKDK